MKKNRNPLPFAARNEEDFNQITERIHAALRAIEADDKIPAASEKLAELAGCTRKTLYNRKWPVEKLRHIKAARKEAAEKPAHPRRGYCEDAGGQAGTEELLAAKIDNLQRENGNLFDRVQSLEEQLKNREDTINALEQDNEALRSANFELQGKMRKNTQAVNSNVVDLNSRLK